MSCIAGSCGISMLAVGFPFLDLGLTEMQQGNTAELCSLHFLNIGVLQYGAETRHMKIFTGV